MTPAEILTLWQAVDQSISELISIQMAATFALLVAVFAAGNRLYGAVLYIALFAYTLFSAYMVGWVASQAARVAAFQEMLKIAMKADSSLSGLADAYYQPRSGVEVTIAIVLLLWLGALIGTFFIRRQADQKTS
jgi:hypothetical protein